MHAARYIRLLRGMRGEQAMPRCVCVCVSARQSTLSPPLRPPLIPSPATQNNNEQRQNSSMHPSVFSADALACLHRAAASSLTHTLARPVTRISPLSPYTGTPCGAPCGAHSLSPSSTSHLISSTLSFAQARRRGARRRFTATRRSLWRRWTPTHPLACARPSLPVCTRRSRCRRRRGRST